VTVAVFGKRNKRKVCFTDGTIPTLTLNNECSWLLQYHFVPIAKNVIQCQGYGTNVKVKGTYGE
jgi:hypothetical protein